MVPTERSETKGAASLWFHGSKDQQKNWTVLCPLGSPFPHQYSWARSSVSQVFLLLKAIKDATKDPSCAKLSEFIARGFDVNQEYEDPSGILGPDPTFTPWQIWIQNVIFQKNGDCVRNFWEIVWMGFQGHVLLRDVSGVGLVCNSRQFLKRSYTQTLSGFQSQP